MRRPRRSSERANPVRRSAARVRTSGSAGCTSEAFTSSSTAEMRKAASISASSCSRRVDSMLARSSASVSNSLAARASSSSSSGQHLLLHLATVDLDVRAAPVGHGDATCFVSPADAPRSAASSSGVSRPLPSSTTVSCCASPSGRRGRRRACRRPARGGPRRARARRPTRGAPRSRRPPTPAAPPPRPAGPRGSSSRRSRAAPAPRPSP